MRIPRNKSGVVNGKLKQIGKSFKADKKHRVAVFRCECGTNIITDPQNVITGASKSCGCGRFGKAINHGHARGNKRTPTHRSWTRMKSRCSAKPGSHHWPYYGAKRITVCDRWNLFEHFLDDMGERPDGHTLDRIDGSKGYSPDNCRWATKEIQSKNVSDIRMITFDNKTMCLKEWARSLGIKYLTLWSRLNDGWSVADALQSPVDKTKRNKRIVIASTEEAD